MTLTHNFCPVPIRDLLGQAFYVPRYQRGYRWTARQVHDLLDDVLAFIEKQSGGFYCLQPIVVKKNGARWDVVDGQQRLTTLSLILTYFNSRLTEEEAWSVFTLDYETRPESKDYLKNPTKERENDYVDFSYIYNAYQAIKNWFGSRKHLRNDIEATLLNKVKVIWYQIGSSENPIDIFMRLNIGKIPLTNAELIKGLFLRSSNFASEEFRVKHLKQTQIAREWDEIERRLQEDSFWYFLMNQTRASNRIDFLLRLYALDIDVDVDHDDPSYLFLAFSQRLNDERADVVDEWANVRRLFLRLDEWYRDRDFYHLIGYLAAVGGPISKVLALAKNKSKRELRDDLKLAIRKHMMGQSGARKDLPAALQAYLEELDYENRGDHRSIKQTLLLFNIATLLEGDRIKTRFPFDLFKAESWDLEHIRSVQSAIPNTPDRAVKWLDALMTYVTGTDEVAIWETMIGALPAARHTDLYLKALAMRNTIPFPMNAFPALAEEIIAHYDPDPDRETDNGIGNLTLLDAATNRSYKNAVFPVKRKTLIALDKSGTFVPVCTKNVFLKYYSAKIDDMLVWTAADASAHRAAMHATLLRFFTPAEEMV